MKWLLIPAVLLVLGLCGYLAACAGAQRWLTFPEWWFLRSPAERLDDQTSRRWEQRAPASATEEPIATGAIKP